MACNSINSYFVSQFLSWNYLIKENEANKNMDGIESNSPVLLNSENTGQENNQDNAINESNDPAANVRKIIMQLLII